MHDSLQGKKKWKAAGGHNYQSDSESWYPDTAFPRVLTGPLSSGEQISTHHEIPSIFWGQRNVPEGP